MTNRPLDQRVALVTGGTGGIGTAICARLHREGAYVIAADRDAPKTALPGGIRHIPLDVTSEDSVKAMIDDIEACLLYTSPSPRDYAASRMPSSA